MGNRATVFFSDDGKSIEAGIYLHWNGGAESVYTFLDYAAANGVRMNDPCYCMARMCQIIGNYFGGTCSIGIVRGPEKVVYLDQNPEAHSPGDNGIFVVHAGKVIARYVGYPAKKRSKAWIANEETAARKHAYNVNGEMLAQVAAFNDAAMPEHYLGAGIGSVTGLARVIEAPAAKVA